MYTEGELKQTLGWPVPTPHESTPCAKGGKESVGKRGWWFEKQEKDAASPPYIERFGAKLRVSYPRAVSSEIFCLLCFYVFVFMF
jgi:hypothetical protein